MAQARFWRRLASALRRMPWLVTVARVLLHIVQPRYTVGAVGVVFNSAGAVLLVEHVFHPTVPWGLPGGWMDRNEAPSDGVARELKEELALEVQVGRVLLIERNEHNHLDVAYLCDPRGDIGHLSRELLSYGWFDPRNLPALPPFHFRAIEQALGELETERE